MAWSDFLGPVGLGHLTGRWVERTPEADGEKARVRHRGPGRGGDIGKVVALGSATTLPAILPWQEAARRAVMPRTMY